MTPIGHISVSYIAGRSLRNLSVPVVILGGLLPDFDFIFIFFDWFNGIHRIVSHNFLFVIVLSLFASALAPSGKKLTTGLSLCAGGIIHLLIDSCMDTNPTNGIGVALLWPFSNVMYSPFNLVHASLNTPGWGTPLKMVKTLVPGLLYEVPWYILALFLLTKKKGKIAA